MTERKFTPPTEFPAEYVDGEGNKITIVGKGVGNYPYAGQTEDGVWRCFRNDGSVYVTGPSLFDIHDLPKTKTHWVNDYGHDLGGFWYDSREEADDKTYSYRIAVIRREWTEGELPKYFAEEV